MCNLSVGVYRRGMKLGEKRGKIRGESRGEKKGWQNAANEFVLRLLKAKMPLSFIVSMSSCSEDEVRQIANCCQGEYLFDGVRESALITGNQKGDVK